MVVAMLAGCGPKWVRQADGAECHQAVDRMTGEKFQRCRKKVCRVAASGRYEACR